jgi:hypothetical protein
MDDLRKFALDMAATSMRGASFTEIVNAAQAFHAFLEPRNEIPESAKTILGGASPPPIPELVQQVRHDADLSQADQSPPPQKYFGPGATMGFPDDDTKTRLIHRAERNDFPPV